MRIRAANGAVELWMYGYVGKDFDGRAVAEAIRGATSILIHMNSDGGDLVEGNVIYNHLKRSGASVVVEIDGVSASAASLIAMAGNEIRMAANAVMMIHEPWAGVEGTASTFEGMADLLTKHTGMMAQTYAARSGQKLERIVEMMRAETWMTAAQAVESGFADKIIQPVKVAATARLNLSRFKNAPPALLAAGSYAMDPKLVLEALDALEKGNAKAALQILKSMIASAAGAEVETEEPKPPKPPEPPAAEITEEPMPTDEEKAIAAAVRKITGKSKPEDVAAALTALADTKAAHVTALADIEALKKSNLRAELSELVRANPRKIASPKAEAYVMGLSSVDAAKAYIETLSDSVPIAREQRAPEHAAEVSLTAEERKVCQLTATSPIDLLAFKKKKAEEAALAGV